MTTVQAPDRNPAVEGNLSGTMRDTLTKWLRDEVDDMLPAIVVSYDDTTNRARVRPMIRVVSTGGQEVNRAEIASVPVYRFGGGGFFIRFPLKPGDLGWIKANDRDISVYLQRAGRAAAPPTKFFHKFSNGLFLPDTLRQWVIAGEDSDAAVLQSLDGATVVSVGAGKLSLRQGASRIDVTAGAVDITSPVLRHNGVNIGATHVHGGVQAGDTTTAVPQ